MAAFIDEAENNLHVKTLKMLRWLQTFPTSSPNLERSFPCIDGLCIPCFWTKVSMQQVSSCLEGSLHSLFGFDLSAPVSWRLEEPSLVHSLENFRLPILNHRASSFLVPGRLFFFNRHSPDWLEIPYLMKKFPPCTGWASPDSQVLLLLSVSHRLRSCSVLVSTWHQSQCARLQEFIEKLYCVNFHRRWFHSFFEKLPSLRMSASWFLVSMYLFWILGSKLILANNQSRATLRVLDTCLIVGLPPLIIILITASLSSKMYNWDSPWEECVLVGTQSTSLNCSTFCLLVTCWVLMLESTIATASWWLVCLGWTLLLVERNTSITMSQRSTASNPYIRNLASREIILDSVELFVFFWTSNWLGQMFCFQHNTPPEVDFSSKIWVLKQT